MEEVSKRKFKYLPLSITTETLGGVATPLVPRGTPLPTKRCNSFSTAADNQVSVAVEIYQGESVLARNNVKIGTLLLEGLPAGKAGTHDITVEFSVDENCAVVARASCGSELVAEQMFVPSAELSDDYIAAVIIKADATSTADRQELLRIEAKNRAGSLVRRAEQQLAEGANERLSKAVAALGLALQSDSSDIPAKATELERILSDVPVDFGGFNFGDLFGPARNKVQPRSGRPVEVSKPTRAEPPAKARVFAPSATTCSARASLGKIFGEGDFPVDSQLCFVLMPFDKALRPVYEDHIQEAVRHSGLRCERADEIKGISLITRDIWESINRARILVADLTNQNPNVFYELGLAHALGKDVIPITQSMDFVPFDLKPLRCIVYEFTPRGTKKLEEDLAATIEALVRTK